MAMCQEYSTLLLIVQGLEDYVTQGNCHEGELLWRAEARAGSCVSLPGWWVCATGTGAGYKTDRYVSANCTSDCSVDTLWGLKEAVCLPHSPLQPPVMLS